jgi:hypothetical protein
VQIDESILQLGFILLPRYAVYSGRSLTLRAVATCLSSKDGSYSSYYGDGCMKHRKESETTRANVQEEMARPRMSKSARIAEHNSDTARISEQPRSVISGTVDKVIPSPTPSLPEKAQISIEGDPGYRDLRIENSLTDEHGD